MTVEVQTIEIKPPAALLKCADWPTPPNPSAGQDMDSDSLEYQERGRQAHADCRGKLDEIRRFYSEEPAP